MDKTFIEQLHSDFYEDSLTSNAEIFYLKQLYKEIISYAGFEPTEKNIDDIADQFTEVVIGLCTAIEVESFRRGVKFCLQLVIDTLYTPDKRMSQILADYNQNDASE